MGIFSHISKQYGLPNLGKYPNSDVPNHGNITLGYLEHPVKRRSLGKMSLRSARGNVVRCCAQAAHRENAVR